MEEGGYMDFGGLNEIEAVEFARYNPTDYLEPKLVLVRNKRAVKRFRAALERDMEETEFYTEDPELPRFIGVIHFQNAPSIRFKAVNRFLLIGDEAYYSKTGGVHRELEKALPRLSLKGVLARLRSRRVHWHDHEPHFQESK
jgi:hypothetical protein